MQEWKTSVVEIQMNPCEYKVYMNKKGIKTENSGINLGFTTKSVRKHLIRCRHICPFWHLLFSLFIFSFEELLLTIVFWTWSLKAKQGVIHSLGLPRSRHTSQYFIISLIFFWPPSTGKHYCLSWCLWYHLTSSAIQMKWGPTLLVGTKKGICLSVQCPGSLVYQAVWWETHCCYSPLLRQVMVKC